MSDLKPTARYPGRKTCGIFGYYNFGVSRSLRSILAIMFGGLSRLEYRGYDSAGISFEEWQRFTCLSDKLSLPNPQASHKVIKAAGNIKPLAAVVFKTLA